MQKDRLELAYAGVLLLYLVVIAPAAMRRAGPARSAASGWRPSPRTVLVALSAASMIAAHVLVDCVAPPARYRDLHTMILTSTACVHFCAFLAYFTYRQLGADAVALSRKLQQLLPPWPLPRLAPRSSSRERPKAK